MSYYKIFGDEFYLNAFISLNFESENKYIFGTIRNDSGQVNRSALIRFNSDTSFQLLNTYLSRGVYNKYGPVNVNPNKILSLDSGNLLLVNALRPRDLLNAEIVQGLIIKVDSMGNEIWRLPIIEDCTSVHWLQVAPLKNGNFLAIYLDFYYQNYCSPPDFTLYFNVNNESCKLNFIEFSSEGKIIRKYDLEKEIKKLVNPKSHYMFLKDILLEKDGSILLMGDISNSEKSRTQGGLIKLTPDGGYEWFRQYELLYSSPMRGSYERLMLHGITKLSNGGYALAGEYRSPISDSFEYGVQKGIVLFVDSMGCWTKDCHLEGCTDPKAYNYDASATVDKGTCILPQCEDGAIELEIYNESSQITRFDSPTIEITGMYDKKVHFRKELYQMARDSYPNPRNNHHPLDSVAFTDVNEVVCLPNTGQCYRLTYGKSWAPYSSLYFKVNSFHDFKGLAKVKNNLYEERYELYIKDGEITHEPCVWGDILPTSPMPDDIGFDTCQIQVFPNPNDGTFQIACVNNGFLDEVDYEIRDIQGRIITSEVNVPLPHHIHLNHLASGLYFINLNSKKINYHKTHKIIKQ